MCHVVEKESIERLSGSGKPWKVVEEIMCQTAVAFISADALGGSVNVDAFEEYAVERG